MSLPSPWGQNLLYFYLFKKTSINPSWIFLSWKVNEAGDSFCKRWDFKWALVSDVEHSRNKPQTELWEISWLLAFITPTILMRSLKALKPLLWKRPVTQTALSAAESYPRCWTVQQDSKRELSVVQKCGSLKFWLHIRWCQRCPPGWFKAEECMCECVKVKGGLCCFKIRFVHGCTFPVGWDEDLKNLLDIAWSFPPSKVFGKERIQ